MKESFAILNDVTLCRGCERCVEACKKENNLSDDRPRRWKSRIDDLSSTRYSTVIRKSGDHFIRHMCRHCLEPACASACIVGALHKTPEGPVIYDSEKCIGCRYCMMACPYGIPRYDWEEPTPYVRKCTMCYSRLEEDQKPACVEACPYEATIFGPRDQLLKEARRRISSSPERYLRKIFGETEIGGTSVLYISDIPLDFLAFRPDLGDEPLPQLTWAALSKVPSIIVGVGGLMSGIWWIINRRMALESNGEISRKKGNTDA